jgi:hypothetical protein
MSVHHRLESIAMLLDGVRWAGNRLSLRARCPVHGGHSASLAFRIHPAEDRIQLKCFAECGALEVLTTLGLDWPALYPDRPHDNRIRRLPPIPYRECLTGITEEVQHVLLAAARLETGKLTEADLNRLVVAVDRIERAAKTAGIRR